MVFCTAAGTSAIFIFTSLPSSFSLSSANARRDGTSSNAATSGTSQNDFFITISPSRFQVRFRRLRRDHFSVIFVIMIVLVIRVRARLRRSGGGGDDHLAHRRREE